MDDTHAFKGAILYAQLEELLSTVPPAKATPGAGEARRVPQMGDSAPIAVPHLFLVHLHAFLHSLRDCSMRLGAQYRRQIRQCADDPPRGYLHSLSDPLSHPPLAIPSRRKSILMARALDINMDLWEVQRIITALDTPLRNAEGTDLHPDQHREQPVGEGGCVGRPAPRYAA